MTNLKHDFLRKGEHKQVQILLQNKCVNFLTQKKKNEKKKEKKKRNLFIIWLMWYQSHKLVCHL